jgi:hypothetical protein
MSKSIDELIAKYGSPLPRKEKSKAVVRKTVAPAREPEPERPRANDLSPKPKHRSVDGLEWMTFEGVDVLRMAGPSTNYVACPSERRPGTFEIYRLLPRDLVVQRVKTKYVLSQIVSLIRQDKLEAERAERWRQETEIKEMEEVKRSENQPGFYLLPGEEDSDDVKKMIPLGPFWKFEAAGPRYSPEDLNDDRFEDDDIEDWAWEQLAEERKKPVSERLVISIIEARNAMEAAKAQGYIWWQDGTFRGSPVDPRQAGWGW